MEAYFYRRGRGREIEWKGRERSRGGGRLGIDPAPFCNHFLIPDST